MCSVFAKIGPLTIHWYGVMMAAAFLAALVNWIRLGRKVGHNSTFCSDMLFWIMLSGIGGARIAYIVSNPSDYINDPLEIIRLDKGGLIYYGGLIGSGIALLLFAKKHSLKLKAFLDFVITAVPLSHALGRIGCFLNGCCYGKHVESWISIPYPPNSHPFAVQVENGDILKTAAHSLPLVPVQLFEAGFNILLYIGLVWLFLRKKRDGSVIAAYLLIYPVGRFFLEFMRGDGRMDAGIFDVAQVVSMALFALGLFILFFPRKRETEK